MPSVRCQHLENQINGKLHSNLWLKKKTSSPKLFFWGGWKLEDSGNPHERLFVGNLTWFILIWCQLRLYAAVSAHGTQTLREMRSQNQSPRWITHQLQATEKTHFHYGLIGHRLSTARFHQLHSASKRWWNDIVIWFSACQRGVSKSSLEDLSSPQPCHTKATRNGRGWQGTETGYKCDATIYILRRFMIGLWKRLKKVWNGS